MSGAWGLGLNIGASINKIGFWGYIILYLSYGTPKTVLGIIGAV